MPTIKTIQGEADVSYGSKHADFILESILKDLTANKIALGEKEKVFSKFSAVFDDKEQKWLFLYNTSEEGAIVVEELVLDDIDRQALQKLDGISDAEDLSSLNHGERFLQKLKYMVYTSLQKKSLEQEKEDIEDRIKSKPEETMEQLEEAAEEVEEDKTESEEDADTDMEKGAFLISRRTMAKRNTNKEAAVKTSSGYTYCEASLKIAKDKEDNKAKEKEKIKQEEAKKKEKEEKAKQDAKDKKAKEKEEKAEKEAKDKKAKEKAKKKEKAAASGYLFDLNNKISNQLKEGDSYSFSTRIFQEVEPLAEEANAAQSFERMYTVGQRALRLIGHATTDSEGSHGLITENRLIVLGMEENEAQDVMHALSVAPRRLQDISDKYHAPSPTQIRNNVELVGDDRDEFVRNPDKLELPEEIAPYVDVDKKLDKATALYDKRQRDMVVAFEPLKAALNKIMEYKPRTSSINYKKKEDNVSKEITINQDHIAVVLTALSDPSSPFYNAKFAGYMTQAFMAGANPMEECIRKEVTYKQEADIHKEFKKKFNESADVKPAAVTPNTQTVHDTETAAKAYGNAEGDAIQDAQKYIIPGGNTDVSLTSKTVKAIKKALAEGKSLDEIFIPDKSEKEEDEDKPADGRKDNPGRPPKKDKDKDKDKDDDECDEDDEECEDKDKKDKDKDKKDDKKDDIPLGPPPKLSEDKVALNTINRILEKSQRVASKLGEELNLASLALKLAQSSDEELMEEYVKVTDRLDSLNASEGITRQASKNVTSSFTTTQDTLGLGTPVKFR